MSGHFLDWLDAADPAATAISDDGGTLTYGDLRREALQVAAGIGARFGSGRYVVLPAERNRDFVRLLCGIALSGNVPVPVDAQAPEGTIAEQVAACGDWVLARPGDFPATGGTGLDRRDPALPALILFTSGTSGVPKGVVVSQANVAHSVAAISEYLGYDRHRSAAIVLPLHYSYALLSQLFCMLAVGGHARLFASFRNPLKFAAAVNAAGLETFCGVPSTYQALALLGQLTPVSMPGVRVLCSAGAEMDRSLLPRLRGIFPNATFFDNYGMTEATPRVAFIRDDDPRFAEATCGRAIPGVEIRILDEHSLAPVAPGQRGIIAVRGPNVFAGYLNDPEATATVFTADGFLLSADLGYQQDGYLFVVGRRDDVFNVGGEKVAPREIERVLANHAEVEACAVSGLHDPQRGMVAAAWVKLRRPVRRKVLVDFLAGSLPPGKVPGQFYTVEQFPLTSNGKLQRSRLQPGNAELGARELT